MLEYLIIVSIWIDIFIDLWILSKQYYEDFDLRGHRNGNSREDGRVD